jgi:RimJ/RimL family protein N-acetyltransferase
VQTVFPDPPPAEGGVVLRRMESDDIGWITVACGDRELSRYVPSIPYPYSEADARAFVDHAARGWAEGRLAVFVIARAPRGPGRGQDQGQGINPGLGLISLHLFASDPGLAEVGYWLCREARGRGVATTAVRLIARWAFRELGIGRLNLQTAPENLASQRVAERAGFTREGLLRAWLPTAGGRRDSVMFSLLPS